MGQYDRKACVMKVLPRPMSSTPGAHAHIPVTWPPIRTSWGYTGFYKISVCNFNEYQDVLIKLITPYDEWFRRGAKVRAHVLADPVEHQFWPLLAHHTRFVSKLGV